jgi:hypothetical protein
MLNPNSPKYREMAEEEWSDAGRDPACMEIVLGLAIVLSLCFWGTVFVVACKLLVLWLGPLPAPW